MVFCNPKKCTSTARLDGKIAIVTGSNTGIGKETVKDFYKRGARVIMACRNLDKANQAAKEIKELCKDVENCGEIAVYEMDLMSLTSVKNCAKQILEIEPQINILVNNAGIMTCPYSKTADGYEIQFGTNHLGHFLFTLLLLPKICKSAPARIVNLSSSGHEVGSIDFEDLNWETRTYSPLQAYGQSKLCNILFTKELATRLKNASIEEVTTYALHPGVVNTELQRHVGDTYNLFTKWAFETVVTPFTKTPEEGAQTSIYCSVDEKCANETGLYYSDCAQKKPSKKARDVEVAHRLWEESVKLVGLEEYDPFKLA